MIEKLSNNSRNTEASGSVMRLIGAYKTTTLSSDVHLAPMLTGLENESTLFIEAINRVKSESILEDKNAVRTDSLRSFHYLLIGFLHHPSKKIRTAAEAVYNIYEHYGLSIIEGGYASASALIVSLLNDLSAEALQESISHLSGLAELIAGIQAAQADFEQTRISFESSKAEESTYATATELKKTVLDIVNNEVVTYMRAMELVDNENYGAFARTIAEIIADNNEQVKKRRNKGDDPKEDDTNGDDPKTED